MGDSQRSGRPSMTEGEIVRVFQERRKRALTFGGPPAALGFGAIAWAMTTVTSPTVSQQAGTIAFIGGLVSFAIGSIVLSTMRCPACGAQPRGIRGGLVMNETRCRRCGARLR
jgi:hypothetical protein